MPCYRCGARQTDPVRGPSPWQRGVRRGAFVLVCPDCQGEGRWRTELDLCAGCGSTRLVRALGELRCRDCGAVEESPGAPDAARGGAGLAEDVAAAVERVLGRVGGRAAGAPGEG